MRVVPYNVEAYGLSFPFRPFLLLLRACVRLLFTPPSLPPCPSPSFLPTLLLPFPAIGHRPCLYTQPLCCAVFFSSFLSFVRLPSASCILISSPGVLLLGAGRSTPHPSRPFLPRPTSKHIHTYTHPLLVVGSHTTCCAPIDGAKKWKHQRSLPCPPATAVLAVLSPVADAVRVDHRTNTSARMLPMVDAAPCQCG